MSNLKIESDFIDFYDNLNNDNSVLIYKRYLKNCKQRGTDMKYLRSLGVKTIELKQVNQLIGYNGQIVVYTDPKAHNGYGKMIMNVDEAMLSYSNCLASPYYFTENNLSIKYLQIGKRRFNLCFQKPEPLSLNCGTLIDIKESEPQYNRLIGLPIFSIDYISTGREMIATDFNEVQNLQILGMNNYISSESIIEEVIQSLAIYNKY